MSIEDPLEPECDTSGRAKDSSSERTGKDEKGGTFHSGPSETRWTIPEGMGHAPGDELSLPEPSAEEGMGDILYGLAPDPDADPVEEVREIRRDQ